MVPLAIKLSRPGTPLASNAATIISGASNNYNNATANPKRVSLAPFYRKMTAISNAIFYGLLFRISISRKREAFQLMEDV